MREECLREFGFSDVYRLDKEQENSLALQVSTLYRVRRGLECDVVCGLCV
jgi:hypothetical protein